MSSARRTPRGRSRGQRKKGETFGGPVTRMVLTPEELRERYGDKPFFPSPPPRVNEARTAKGRGGKHRGHELRYFTCSDSCQPGAHFHYECLDCAEKWTWLPR